MDEVRYMISEASKRVDVEAHTLRYWEEELELPIARNEMGHRYYKDMDIELLKSVKRLKEQGFQLKALKMLLPNIHELDNMDSNTLDKLKEEFNGKVMNMLDETMEKENHEEGDGTSIVNQVNEVSNESNENGVNEVNQINEVSDVSDVGEQEIAEVGSDKIAQFQTIMKHIILNALKENNSELAEEITTNVTDGVIKEMNYLMRLQEQREEERFKKFDASLREYQRSRMYTAAAFDAKSRRKSKFFKKHKVYI